MGERKLDMTLHGPLFLLAQDLATKENHGNLSAHPQDPSGRKKANKGLT